MQTKSTIHNVVTTARRRKGRDKKEREREGTYVYVYVRECAKSVTGDGRWTLSGGARWGPQCAVVVRAGWITYQSRSSRSRIEGLCLFTRGACRVTLEHIYERTSAKSRELYYRLIDERTNERTDGTTSERATTTTIPAWIRTVIAMLPPR